MSLPSLDEFARATLERLTSNALDDYPPTFVFEHELLTLQKLPAAASYLDAVQEQAQCLGWHQLEFLFGVRSGPDVLTVGYYDVGAVAFRELRRGADGWAQRAISTPSWWWLEP